MAQRQDSGYAGRVSVPNLHGFSAQMVFSSVAARFFQPQIGGAGANRVEQYGTPVPHRPRRKVQRDDAPAISARKRGPVFGFNWRYDSGLVAGSNSVSGADCHLHVFDLDGGWRIGPQHSRRLRGHGYPSQLAFDRRSGVFSRVRLQRSGATPTHALPTVCPASEFESALIKVPAPGAENDDHNPQRIAPRNLFDASVGHDNLFKGDRYKWSLTLTAINVNQ